MAGERRRLHGLNGFYKTITIAERNYVYTGMPEELIHQKTYTLLSVTSSRNAVPHNSTHIRVVWYYPHIIRLYQVGQASRLVWLLGLELLWVLGFGFRGKDCSLYKIIRQIFYFGTYCTGNENKDRDDRTRLVFHDRAYHYMTFWKQNIRLNS